MKRIDHAQKIDMIWGNLAKPKNVGWAPGPPSSVSTALRTTFGG